MTSAEVLREQVRAKYAESARAVAGDGDGCGSDGCCVDNTEGGRFGEALYAAEQRGELPDAAVLASLGCGNPTAVADLHEGETVLDLGSGGGIDVILSARRVGPTGTAYGLDMTDEMLALARQNARDAGVQNVHFLKGLIEQIPLPADSVDVVISNCVINLSTDKAAVLAEISRVLRPGGRVIVLEFSLPTNRVLRGLYNFYFRKILPRTATFISGDKTGAYKYLPESVSTFIGREQMAQMMKDAGFVQVEQRAMTFGVCVCYRGTRP
jgi:ubiquinone/menaquinone biosynthesis methyltransferase